MNIGKKLSKNKLLFFTRRVHYQNNRLLLENEKNDHQLYFGAAVQNPKDASHKGS